MAHGRIGPIGRSYTNTTAQVVVMKLSGGSFLLLIFNRTTEDTTHSLYRDWESAIAAWEQAVVNNTPGGLPKIAANRRRGLRTRIANIRRAIARCTAELEVLRTGEIPELRHHYETLGDQDKREWRERWEQRLVDSEIPRLELSLHRHIELLESGNPIPRGVDLDYSYYGGWTF